MAGQEHAKPTKSKQDDDVDIPEDEGAPQGAETTSTDNIDDLLDDIDDALETNAESFVRQFQQKGGQ